MQINLAYGAWIKIARALADHSSLSVQYVTESHIRKVGAQAWTSGSTLYLREPCTTWTQEQFKLWLYFMIHEIGHCTPSRIGAFDVLKNKEPTGFLAYIYNVLEDHVQERELFEARPVLRKYLGEGRAQFYAFMIGKRTDEQKMQLLATPQAPTLYAWDAGLRTFMKPLLGWNHRLLAEVKLDPRVIEWTAKLNAGDYASVLKNGPDPDSLFELAERILHEVFDENPEQQQGDQGKQEKGNGEESEGKGEQGDQQGAGEPGDETGPDGDQCTSDTGGDGDSGKPASQAANVDYNDLLNHDHGATERAGGSSDDRRGAGINIDYDRYFANPVAGDEFKPRFDSLEVFHPERGEYPNHDHRDTNVPVEPSSLTKRVGRYMQANSLNRKLHNQKQGRLSNKNLYRLRVKGIGDARERVFHKRVLNKSKDVAVTIAVDMSGSMEGMKSGAAIAAVTHLHEVLSKQLRIPLEILGYSAEYNHGVHIVIQGFNKVRRNENVEDDMRRILPFRGANRDGELLLWARDRLMAKKAARHIMIVLSDGQPRAPGSGDVAGFTRDVIQSIETDGRIELHALGIMSEQVSHFYESYDVIQEPSQLEAKLLSVLKNRVINHTT